MPAPHQRRCRGVLCITSAASGQQVSNKIVVRMLRQLPDATRSDPLWIVYPRNALSLASFVTRRLREFSDGTGSEGHRGDRVVSWLRPQRESVAGSQ